MHNMVAAEPHGSPAESNHQQDSSRWAQLAPATKCASQTAAEGYATRFHGRQQLTQDAKGIDICTPCEAALRQQLWRHVGHSAIGFCGNAGGASKNSAETKI